MLKPPFLCYENIRLSTYTKECKIDEKGNTNLVKRFNSLIPTKLVESGQSAGKFKNFENPSTTRRRKSCRR